MINFLLPLFYSFLFLFIIKKNNFFLLSGINKKIIYWIFILKIFSGICIAMVYTSIYDNRLTSDMFYFFDDSKYLFEYCFQKPWNFFKIMFGFEGDNLTENQYLSKMQYWHRATEYGVPNDNKTIIKFNVISRFFSFGEFYVHVVFMSFLSFLGQVALYKTLYNILKEKKWIILFCCFLVPSVMVWSSSVLKDGILFFAMGFYIHYLFKILVEKYAFKNLIYLVVFFILCSSIKGYTLFATIPATLCILYFKFFSTKYFVLKSVFIHLLALVLIFNLKFIIKDYDVLYMMFVKQKDMINTGIQANAGSLIYIPRISSFSELIFNSPYALYNSLLRPHVFEIKSILYIVPAFENILIILLTIVAIFNFKKPKKSYWFIVLFILSFSIFMMLLIGHTVPILGSSTRYRSVVLPFIFLLIFIFIDFDKLSKKYTFLHKLNFLLK
jgi:hypothetical protein